MRHGSAADERRGGVEAAITDIEADNLRVVHHPDAEALGSRVVAVHERLAAAQEERVRAGQVQRAAQGGLKADAESPHPRPDSLPSRE